MRRDFPRQRLRPATTTSNPGSLLRFDWPKLSAQRICQIIDSSGFENLEGSTVDCANGHRCDENPLFDSAQCKLQSDLDVREPRARRAAKQVGSSPAERFKESVRMRIASPQMRATPRAIYFRCLQNERPRETDSANRSHEYSALSF